MQGFYSRITAPAMKLEATLSLCRNVVVRRGFVCFDMSLLVSDIPAEPV